MYHLSKEMTGVLLPHDTYGTHLENGKTIDTELEKRNFKAAGETLCGIWSDLVIDGYQTVADFIEDPPSDEIQNYVVTAKFRNKHVFESQYMVVYLKCDDFDCCEGFVTDVKLFFPHRSIPPLIPIKRTEMGVVAVEKNDLDKQKLEFLSVSLRIVFKDQIIPAEYLIKYGDNVPYDLYLPSVQDQLDKRICRNCKKYHATQKSLKFHQKDCPKPKSKKKTRAFIESDSEEDDETVEADLEPMGVGDDISDLEDEFLHPTNIVELQPTISVSFPDSGFVEKIENLKEWLKSPWVIEEPNNN